MARGYERLNRDTEGGTLRKIARLLEERLAAGAQRIVLDNTYVTRASRYDVVRVASARGARARCLHLETPLADAQINVILRMLRIFGRVPDPEELSKRARADPAALAPHAVFRMMRELELPSLDEGFWDIERVTFVREHLDGGVAGTAVALAALGGAGSMSDRLVALLHETPEASPSLVYAWRPGAAAEWFKVFARRFEAAGAATGRTSRSRLPTSLRASPICWCRPPLPRWCSRSPTVIGSICGSASSVGASTTESRRWRARWDDSGRAERPHSYPRLTPRCAGISGFDVSVDR